MKAVFNPASRHPLPGQASLEVYAELTQSGIAAITQMPNGQLIIGYHPFYLTPTSVQVATLNADRKSSTPYPSAGSGLLQSCRNADGSFLPPVSGRYDFCIDWVLGFHADANGILWILDSAKSTDRADQHSDRLPCGKICKPMPPNPRLSAPSTRPQASSRD